MKTDGSDFPQTDHTDHTGRGDFEAQKPAVAVQPLANNGHSTDQSRTPVRIMKRNGQIVDYDIQKIVNAILKCMYDVEGDVARNSESARDRAVTYAQLVETALFRRKSYTGTFTIEEIQDLVELELMRNSEQKLAHAYVIFREKRAEERRIRQERVATNAQQNTKSWSMIGEDGSTVQITPTDIQDRLARLCSHWQVDSQLLWNSIESKLRDDMPVAELDTVIIISGRVHVPLEPKYTYVLAQVLLEQASRAAAAKLGITTTLAESPAEFYQHLFKTSLQRQVQLDIVNPELLTFDLDKLAQELLPERDRQMTFLGAQTLYDRYFIHEDEVRIELPQTLWMRVAMGLALQEDEREERAIEFYRLLSSFDYMTSTPTLFNSGTNHSQLSSCYLMTVDDSLDRIYDSMKDNAMLSKWAGGLGNDWTPVRAEGSYISGTNGKSQGIVPFLKVVNDTAVAVNQGGKRKGAVCSYLESWHLDIEKFLQLRKNTGDDRIRTHDMNTANWIPDLLMKRVLNDEEWTLFSPHDCPDLHETYGRDFEQRYCAYEVQAKAGDLRSRTIKAVDLWRQMLSMLYETGMPWLTFKDPCNIRSPQQHAGVVHSSNLCTEITLNTSHDPDEGEIAVCNLGSVNLEAHTLTNGKIDYKRLQKTINTAVRMLDNVIDINFYAVPAAERSNLKHRPVGLGLMGYQDALYKANIPYGSEASVEFADRSMEAISYFAINASSDLSAERGAYTSYDGSLWSQGILPIDSVDLLEQERGSDYLSVDRSQTLDWESLRTKVQSQGMRNSNVMAIAPTATIANIIGVEQSIEPSFQHLYAKSNMSGEFIYINPWLVDKLKDLNLWDESMLADLQHFQGSVQKIERIPEEVRHLFATAFELNPRWLLEAASRRQKWIDQSQSLNLYMAAPDGKKLAAMYQNAWLLGLKTTYYLRATAATQVEGSANSSTEQSHNAVDRTDRPLPVPPAPVTTSSAPACLIDDPDCEACQ